MTTFFAVRYAAAPPDDEHRFGHGKAEAFASLVQAGLVFGSAALIGREAIDHLLRPSPVQAQLYGIVVLVVSTVALLAAAAAEEVVLRGWLLQQTAAFTRKLLIVLALNAVLFAFIHLDRDPLRNIALFASGVSLGVIALRTGGLEFGIGVHAGNNLMLAWFVATFPLGDLNGQMRLGDLIAQLIVTFSGLGLAELT
eukprot:gene19488-24671_t